MSDALLRIEDLAVCYGDVQALNGVSLEVPEGKLVTVIGPNGAGKTTLVTAVMGLIRAAGGRVSVDGRDCLGVEPKAMVDLGIGLVTENRDLFGEMSVDDNLILGAFPRRRAGRAAREQSLEEIYTLFPQLKDRRRQLARTLSGGERQMLALGRALMAKPRLLMLDEPSLGLAPRIVREILQHVAKLRDKGIGILLIEQNARAALQIADYGYVLELGKITHQGTGDALMRDSEVSSAYLGMLMQQV
jgi:branched-chain amino acid transport system ATP-binding protein